jgi:ABC-2 type transport system permease protein/lipopolysaccharide transport system permease protein
VTSADIALPARPAPELRFRRDIRLVPSLREIWRSRELLRTLAERDYRVRYKQAVLGFAWAVLTPLALMVVFTLFFQKVAHVPHGNVPYPLFAYLGLLPWTFLSNSLNQGGLSLVNNVPLLNKVYCPREVFPLGSMCVAALDTTISMTGLVLLFAVFHRLPQVTTLWLPVLLTVQVAWTLGLTLVASIVIVYLRDVRYALPVVLQLGLFATPVAYGLDRIPVHLRGLYVTLNPLAAVIDGYRRTVLFGQAPQWRQLGLAATTAFLTLGLGYWMFKKLEAGIADVA